MTSNITPQSLLSLPPETQASDAYQILKLPNFESSRGKIKAAVDDAMSRLNQVRSTVDEGVWAIASQWVKNSYAILGDPGKKAAYDRKLAAENATKAPTVDPLAGFLPDTLQKPAFHPGQATTTGAPRKPTAPTMEPQPAFSPSVGPAAMPESPSTYHQTPAPLVSRRSRAKSRRGLPWISMFLILFCILGLAGLGGVLYFLQKGDLPSVVINSQGVKVAASGDKDGDGRVVGVPGEVPHREPRKFDPVMGGLAGDMPPPRPPANDVETVKPTRPMVDPPSPTVPMPKVPTPETPMPEVPAPETPMAEVSMPEMPAPSEEQIKAGDIAVAAIVTAIKQHDWLRMKQLANDAQAAAASDQQKEQAEMLFELVDLATYYRGGIDKAIGTLAAGNELDISDELKVVVVEKGPNKLIIRFNGKNKEYTFDTLPLTIAHKVARLTLPSDLPTNQAAKHCFQAVAAVTTPPYREAAIAELEKITEEIEGAEPAKLIAAIRLLYQP